MPYKLEAQLRYMSEVVAMESKSQPEFTVPATYWILGRIVYAVSVYGEKWVTESPDVPFVSFADIFENP